KDHDHYTGLYRGAAHNDCNLNFYSKKGENIELRFLDSNQFFNKSLAELVKNLDFDQIIETKKYFTNIDDFRKG
ncbi:hypothetical protein B4U80_14839, partial [Leptotrombidium deliense]